MNSAPAVLRMPAIPIESINTPAEMQNFPTDSYPWAAHTPEASPRCWSVEPDMDAFGTETPVQPVLSQELLRTVCAPYFDQMCYSVSTQMNPAKTMVSHDGLRTMCEPFFEQMITALQQTLQHQSSQQTLCQPTIGTYFQPVFYPTAPFFHMDDESTEADDSCAFTSLLSGSSSEVDVRPDAAEVKSENSEPTSDVERSTAVCRHWKSKGWCRLESKCKFLHPERECGTAAGVKACGDADGVVPPISTEARRKKRAGKNRPTKGQEQLGNVEPRP